MRIREAKRRQNGGQEAPQERPRTPKRGTSNIDPETNVLIPSAAHIPPRARVGRIMRGATHEDTVVKRPKIDQKRVPGAPGDAQIRLGPEGQGEEK